MQHIHHLQQRDHDRLKGDQHGCDDQRMDEFCVFILAAIQDVGRKGGEEDDSGNPDDSYYYVIGE